MTIKKGTQGFLSCFNIVLAYKSVGKLACL